MPQPLNSRIDRARLHLGAMGSELTPAMYAIAASLTPEQRAEVASKREAEGFEAGAALLLEYGQASAPEAVDQFLSTLQARARRHASKA